MTTFCWATPIYKYTFGSDKKIVKRDSSTRKKKRPHKWNMSRNAKIVLARSNAKFGVGPSVFFPSFYFSLQWPYGHICVPKGINDNHVLTKSSKLWSSQLWTQFKQLRIEAWKSQDFNGIWTRDLAIPVRRSNQLIYEATDVGSWSFVSSNEPVKNGCELIYDLWSDISLHMC